MAKNLGIVKALHVGTVAPTNTDMIWRDTSVSPAVHKAYNSVSGQWEPFANVLWVVDDITAVADIYTHNCLSSYEIIHTLTGTITTNKTITKSNDENAQIIIGKGEATGTVTFDFSAFNEVICDSVGNGWTFDDGTSILTFNAVTQTRFEYSLVPYINGAIDGWNLIFRAFL